MSYRTLFKRGFRSFPFLISIVVIAFNVGVFTYVSLVKHKRIPVDVWGPLFAFLCAFLGWGIAHIIKEDTCRKSTLMIPNFRKRLTNFYILLGTLGIFLIVILPLMPSMPSNFFFFLGLGLSAYGLSLFISHFFPIWIAFTYLLMQIPRIFNLHLPAQIGPSIAISLLLAGSILILLYRQAIIHLTEEAAFFRALPYAGRFNIRGLLRQTKAFYARRNFWTNGYRVTFEFFLHLLHRLNIPKDARIFVLSTLKNHISWLSFHTLIFLLLLLTLFKPFVSLYLILFPAIIMCNTSMYRNRHLQIDALKPVRKSRLFLTEYTGNYLSVIIIILVLLIVTKMPDTISGKLFPHTPVFGKGHLAPYISGGLLVVSLLLLLMNRFRRDLGMNYLIVILSIGIVSGVIGFCIEVINEMILSLVLLVLTILFSFISFKLDLKKDII